MPRKTRPSSKAPFEKNPAADDLHALLRRWQKQSESALRQHLPRPTTWPTQLHRAMHYSVFSGGKRIRPALLYASAEACYELQNPNSPSLPPAILERANLLAAAVEFIHTYSLIHDDLPCMDNDDLRRGRPTCHKVFGEAIAILAGDALLTHAFATLAKLTPTSNYPQSQFAACLASAAGSSNLVGGQTADLLAENQKISLAQLRQIHSAKTAALISASTQLGAMAADAPPTITATLAKFGFHLGLAFQAIDDILDITSSQQSLGKTPGKDAAAGKATYPALLGLPKAQAEARRLTRSAIQSLKPLDSAAHKLHLLANYLLARTN